MAKNVYRVPKKQWKRWSKEAQKAFNRVFRLMRDPDLYKHPAAPKPKREHWQTTRWNAAWTAAEVATGNW